MSALPSTLPPPPLSAPAIDRRLLGRADWVWLLGLAALGLGLRVLWASGAGLADDFIFRGEIVQIVQMKQVLPDNQWYRFVWWFPAALSCRILGLNEVGLVAPFTVAATLGIMLVYVLGKALWGRTGAIIAALLLIVTPLDFAWSTMMTNDIMLSALSAATVLLVLRALDHADPVAKQRCWFLAGVTFWLGCHAKLSGLLLAPALAAIALTRRRGLDRRVATFVVTVAVLLSTSLLVSYTFTGDPLFPYHAELSFQGLSAPTFGGAPISRHVLAYFPRLLFLPDDLGDLLFSVYPHLLVALAVVGIVVGLRSSLAVFWWLLFVFLGMEFNFQHVGDFWVTGFRNIRHLHVLAYPIVLLLTGYLVGLRARWPRGHDVALALLLAFSGWESVSAAWKTKVAFADRRAACRYIATLPRKPTYSDQGLAIWCVFLDSAPPQFAVTSLSGDPGQRRGEIAAIRSGYVVTGGAREPIYGCPACIPRAQELPAGRWRLLTELPGPTHPLPWREEPLRVWETGS